ncbi:MAG: hypothetical protein D6788_08365 [Planctomycetota bacterium]|nr:MAG: hypothetical protein D6788_08365 [Planctomycetota bacterium]
MTGRLHRLSKRLMPLLAAGYLLQAGGCTTIDTNLITQGLLTAILNNLITDIVFGVFNVPI